MKAHRGARAALLLCSIAAVPLIGLAFSSCKSASYGSVTSAGAETGGPAGPATPARLVTEYDALADEILAARKKEIEIVKSILEAARADAAAALGKARSAIKSGDRKAAQAGLEDLAAAIGLIGTEGDGSCSRIRKRLVEGGHHHNPAAGHHPAGHGGEHHSGGSGAAGEGAHHAKPGAEGHAKSPEGHAKSPEGHAKSPEGHAASPGAHAKPGEHAHAGGSHGFDLGYVIVDRGAKKVFLDASQAIARLSTAPDAALLDQEWAKVEAAWAGLWKDGK